jgi:hypothetical protein
MADRKNEAKERLRRDLKAIALRNRQAFEGTFATEIEGLLGLSRAEIDAITPDGTDLAVYADLIEVVKDASRKNLSQADLKRRIRALGEVSVRIANKVGPLAKLLA